MSLHGSLRSWGPEKSACCFPALAAPELEMLCLVITILFLLNGLKCLTSSLQSYPRKASLPFQGLESGSQAPTPAFVRDSGHISKLKHFTDRLDSEGPSKGNTGAFVAASSHTLLMDISLRKRGLFLSLELCLFSV